MTSSPHPLDHLVLPTVNIALARERLGKLGFTVAPDARHPFGTENACVFFSDKTYLEPLGVASQEQCEASIADGNVFVARDQAYRFRVGDDGFRQWSSARMTRLLMMSGCGVPQSRRGRCLIFRDP